jgi:hypothetical protein
MKFLYAAYIVTWLVHLTYLGILSRGYKRLRDEVEEAKKQ